MDPISPVETSTNPFDWDHFTMHGVTDAWGMLFFSKKLRPSIDVAIIDAGFAIGYQDQCSATANRNREMKASDRLVVVGLFGISLVACGEDDSGGAPKTTGGQAGLAGASAGSAGAAGTSGGAPGGTAGLGGASASTGGASAGAEPMTAEELWAATYVLCDEACFLEKSACPELDLATCVGTCRQQADNYLASGTCAREHYLAYLCVTTTQQPGDLTCIPNGVEFAGCQTEIGAYDACVGN